MPIPRRRMLRRSLAAVALTATAALTACTADTAAPGAGASDGGGQAPAASDGGGSPLGKADPQAAPEPDLSGVPDVVATVNGTEISKDEFTSAYEGQFQQAAMQQQAAGQEVDQQALKEQVANQLVDNELLRQGADAAGIEASEKDVDATLEQVAAQNGMGSGDEVVAALEQQGLSEQEIREQAATQFAITTFIEQEGDLQEPSDEELKQQYDAMVAQQEQSGGDPAQIPPFEEAKEQIAQQVRSQQQGEVATTLAAELRKAGEVQLHL